MLVRNPKKRPSASKMLSVSFIHCFYYGFQLICIKKKMERKMLGACFLQHMFLTQQCLNRELTLDLLEKFHNPEKIRTCQVSEDEDMEVYHCLLFLLSYFSSVDE